LEQGPHQINQEKTPGKRKGNLGEKGTRESPKFGQLLPNNGVGTKKHQKGKGWGDDEKKGGWNRPLELPQVQK